jgi:hypothetical protein
MNSGKFVTVRTLVGRAMAQEVSRRPLITEAQVRAQFSPCGICGGQSGTETGFYPSSSVLPCQYHSIMDLLAYVSPGDWIIGRWCPQFRDIVLPHWHEQQQQQDSCTVGFTIAYLLNVFRRVIQLHGFKYCSSFAGFDSANLCTGVRAWRRL